MKELFLIGEAAKAVNTTPETLRHYDRIGLVKPSKKSEWTNYRYYTKQDIVRLNTVRALQQMDLPLQKIKEVLEYDDLRKIIAFLSEAEKNADEKIAALQYSKAKILTAKNDYESKLHEQSGITGCKINEYPTRIILLSDTLITPTLDNLWNYLSHFYNNIPEPLREQFQFENSAGVYTSGGHSKMFAVCTRFAETEGIKTLPAGQYLCSDCTEKEKTETTNQLMRIAEKEFNVIPKFIIEQIIVSGILQWKYQVQVYVGETVETV
jgi:MerR family transcriptional activator of bmr gene